MNFKATDYLGSEVPDDLTIDETIRFIYSLDWWKAMCARHTPRVPILQFWDYGVSLSGTVTMGEWRKGRAPSIFLILTDWDDRDGEETPPEAPFPPVEFVS